MISDNVGGMLINLSGLSMEGSIKFKGTLVHYGFVSK